MASRSNNRDEVVEMAQRNPYARVPSTVLDDGVQRKTLQAEPLSELLQPVSIWHIIGITCFNLPYGLICGTMGLFILPAESTRLYPAMSSMALGASLLVVGVSQLICPLAGRMSDAWPGKAVRKRAPFMLIGSLVATGCTFGMWICSELYLGPLYYVNLFTGMLALNVVYSVQCGLVPDYVGDDQQGMSSGIVAVHGVMGSGFGFAAMIASTTWDYHLMYPLYATTSVTCVIISICASYHLDRTRKASKLECRSVDTCAVDSPPTQSTTTSIVDSFSDDEEMPTTSVELHETRGQNRSLDNPSRRSSMSSIDMHAQSTSCIAFRGSPRNWKCMHLTCNDVFEAYTIDMSKSYDFFWVFLGRTFYYVGVSVTAFVMFFLRDVVGTLDMGERRKQIGLIALVAQTTAASVAYPMGKLSDNPKVGMKKPIYVACFFMSSVYIGYLICPLFGTWAFAFVLTVSVLYGAANGCFLAVDYGLALATLPNKEKAAQALGIWGVSAFLGTALGPFLWGLLIQVFGGDGFSFKGILSATGLDQDLHAVVEEKRFTYAGYEAMLLGGVIANILAGVTIHFVKLAPVNSEESSVRDVKQVGVEGGDVELPSYLPVLNEEQHVS